MNRRRILQSAALALCPAACHEKTATPPPAATPAAPADPTAFASLTELTARMQSGKATPATILQHYLDRIERIDRTGPKVNAILELNPDAKAIASAPKSGLLQGLPVLIKDNIETSDAMQTTAGSLALRDHKPKQDAPLVTRLREAGAVILGKTNLSEWANIRSPRSTSGWSARGGLTRNPHKLTHTASGSSSGSAAAVAAGLAPAAIGTETNGSIISPASACGIVGFKPTVGRISGAGIIPITHHQDTAGPMTLTVRDAALLMQVIAGDFKGDLPADALKGARLGVLRGQSGRHPQVLGMFEAMLQKLREAGAVVIDSVTLPNARQIGGLAWKALLVELRTDLNAYLEQRGGDVRSLSDLINFNKKHRDTEMPHFGQETFEQAEALGAPEVIAAVREVRAQARQLAGPEGIDAALKEHKLDALICPTNDPAGVIDLSKGDVDVRVVTTPAAVAGYPHLTVPMGLVDGLPVGFSFIGTARDDERILAFGHAFEQLTRARVSPAL